ncbi:hypothetical protein HBH56_023080 [Parastagonospora nodorum]|nr:hypothetical protein HBH56_023080 [Parastagonospora nodorum]KAH3934392.1 hypothetical protein HBH54_058970 [Parastagonospora nodorum]KAH4006334.1 hypothetical protein HBI10_030020 [Parastagonospora nodorum]KAH4008147.1 hypothetical protein HBI13_240650 [Parastagonospora nodorum]KAH4141640.1 hypothetical protein HBH45_057820 [Parastagonospora nodorum]
MGLTDTNAQLMTVPPYVVGAISSVVFARLANRVYWRLPCVAIPLSFIFIGYAVIISFDGKLGENIGPAFFAIILTCMGIYPVQPTGSSWAANNLAPSSRRAIGVAFIICVGDIGGFIIAFVLELSYKWGNTRKARRSEEEVRATCTDEELLDMGDKSPLFKYTL